MKPEYMIKYHERYLKWRDKLRDDRALARISARVEQIRELGNFGDHKYLRDGVSELRIHYGPGYRIYYTQSGGKIVLLLCGGDKSKQANDINLAVKLAKEADNVQ